MKIVGDEVVFSTGKRLYANCGIIGLSPRGGLTEGYDGSFYEPECGEPSLSPQELVELADYMLARWQEFRAKCA